MSGGDRAVQFLEAIRSESTDTFIEIRCIGAGKPQQEWFRDPTEAIQYAQRMDSHGMFDVYVGMAPRDRKEGTEKAVSHAYIVSADCDSDAALAALDTFPLPPSIRVASGGRTESGRQKIHAHWWLDSPCTADELRAAKKALISALDSDPAISDPPRIMRLPRTHHRKGVPTLVKVLDGTWQRISLPEVHAACAAAPKRTGARFDFTGLELKERTVPTTLRRGEWHQPALRLAGQMRRQGGTEEEILAALRAFTESRGDGSIKDEWICDLAADVAKRYPAGGTAPANIEPLPVQHSWLPVPLPLDTEPLTPDIAGLMFRGLTHEFSGPSEAGKTMMLAAAAINEARAGRHVVWLDFEMGKRLMARRLLDGLNVPVDEVERLVNDPDTRRFHFMRPTVQATAAYLDSMLAQTGLDVSLVVIDAMTGALALHELDSNSDIDIERLYAVLVNPLKDIGAAVAIIDHPGKDAGRGSKGSIRKEQALDVAYLVSTARQYRKGLGGSSRIVVKKDRGGELDRSVERQFVLTPSGWRFDCDHEFRPTTLMERASRYLEPQPAPLSRNSVYAECEGREAELKVALDVLVSEGYVGEVDGPRGARLSASIRPYRQTEDPKSDVFRLAYTGSAVHSCGLEPLAYTGTDRLPKPVAPTGLPASLPMREAGRDAAAGAVVTELFDLPGREP